MKKQCNCTAWCPPKEGQRLFGPLGVGVSNSFLTAGRHAELCCPLLFAPGGGALGEPEPCRAQMGWIKQRGSLGCEVDATPFLQVRSFFGGAPLPVPFFPREGGHFLGTNSLPEFMNFKLFWRTILVVDMKFGLFLGHPLRQ